MVLPDPSMDVNLEEQVKIACALLDVPIHPTKGNSFSGTKNAMIESLHVLFSLYLTFKNNAHFQSPDSMALHVEVESKADMTQKAFDSIEDEVYGLQQKK